jgi:hypothetical protein
MALIEMQAYEVTRHGCLLDNGLPEGAEIWISLANVAPIRATVVAAEGNASECEFYTAFDVLRLRRSGPILRSAAA